MDKLDNQWFKDIIEYLSESNQIENLKDLAKKTGYNYTYISRIKNGHDKITKEFVQTLSDTFSIPENRDIQEKTKNTVNKVEDISEEYVIDIKSELERTKERVEKLEIMNQGLMKLLETMTEQNKTLVDSMFQNK